MMTRLTIISLLILGMISTKMEIDRLRFENQTKIKVRQMQRFERERSPTFYDTQDSFPKYYYIVPPPTEINL